jgi:hypothetical protein
MISMKKYFIFLPALILMLSRCDCNRRVIHKYVLENGTDKEVKIQLYRYGVLGYEKTVKGKDVLFERVIDNDKDAPLIAQLALNADSAIVTFEYLKKQIYTYVYSESGYLVIPQTRNVFLDSSYTIENIELYRFTFTEEDYNNAEPIIAE